MQLSMFFNVVELIFTVVSMFKFGILVGDNDNGLVGWLYYIKFI